MRSGVALLAIRTTFIFESFFFQFASISSKFIFPTKFPTQVLYSAMNELEKVVSRLKEVGFFVRHLEKNSTEMSLSTASSQNLYHANHDHFTIIYFSNYRLASSPLSFLFFYFFYSLTDQNLLNVS